MAHNSDSIHLVRLLEDRRTAFPGNWTKELVPNIKNGWTWSRSMELDNTECQFSRALVRQAVDHGEVVERLQRRVWHQNGGKIERRGRRVRRNERVGQGGMERLDTVGGERWCTQHRSCEKRQARRYFVRWGRIAHVRSVIVNGGLGHGISWQFVLHAGSIVCGYLLIYKTRVSGTLLDVRCVNGPYNQTNLTANR